MMERMDYGFESEGDRKQIVLLSTGIALLRSILLRGQNGKLDIFSKYKIN
jgi:hypothetical protein